MSPKKSAHSRQAVDANENIGIDKKTQDALGKETTDELDKLSADQLKDRIVQANEAMKKAKEERDANPKYVQAKNDVSLLNSGLREVNKRQSAIIRYSLYRRNELGK